MKDFYEDRTRFKLARRTNTIIRIDGKAFHTYTKGLERPFDLGFMEDMNKTTEYLCQNIQGAKFGYVQSDEISILITDYDDISTHAWFDGNLQKMASIAASLATAEFNRLRLIRKMNTTVATAGSILEQFKHAMFDARVFQIPYQEEVLNYFIWRQQDATRNSISSVAQSLYSTKELHGKKTNEMVLDNVFPYKLHCKQHIQVHDTSQSISQFENDDEVIQKEKAQLKEYVKD